MVKELMALAAAEAVVAGRRKAAHAMLYAIAALFAFAAVGFALGGMHTILAADYGPAQASFLIAGGLFLLALVIFFSAKLWRPRRTTGELLATAAIVAAPAATRLLTHGAAKGAAVMGSLALGALLGRKVAGEH